MQKKTLYFKANETNAPGPLYFESEHALAPGVKGKGAVRYQEGSVYCGDLIFDGKDFQKLGDGCQDFTQSSLTSCDAGGPIGAKLYQFIGQYDYRKTQWIYGNGIVYFTTTEGKPFGFIKGFFSGLRRIKPMEEHVRYTLLEGYEETMELPFVFASGRVLETAEQIRKKQKTEVLFIGASWFEFFQKHANPAWQGNFDAQFSAYDYLNIGIGGTTYRDWISRLEEVQSLQPKTIVVNLGFNDVHLYADAKIVKQGVQAFYTHLRTIFPTIPVIVMSISPSPCFAFMRSMEEEVNLLLHEIASKDGNMFYVETKNMFIEADAEAALETFFVEDRIHLNLVGYRIFGAKIKAALQKVQPSLARF